MRSGPRVYLAVDLDPINGVERELHVTDAKKRERTPEEIVRRLPRLSAEETARRGRDIYRRDIRHQVIDDHVGKIVTIDIESGQWALGDNDLESNQKLRATCPEATELWAERVGYVAVGSIGGGFPKRDK